MGGRQELHGNLSYYTNHKCRCERCKMARRDYMRGYRAKKKLALAQETRASTENNTNEKRISLTSTETIIHDVAA